LQRAFSNYLRHCRPDLWVSGYNRDIERPGVCGELMSRKWILGGGYFLPNGGTRTHREIPNEWNV
jgi:hypothetical protein